MTAAMAIVLITLVLAVGKEDATGSHTFICVALDCDICVTSTCDSETKGLPE